MKLMLVVGARPNFIKIAPLERECQKRDIKTIIVHTGQHYDTNMSEIFFRDLNIRPPDVCLNIGADTPTNQIAKIMLGFGSECTKHQPDMVVVVGDVNSTVACALAANKAGIPLAHIEAGLRSHDRTMPEEINRIITDSISDILFTPSLDANENLQREGIAKARIHMVGNIVIDSLLFTSSQPDVGSEAQLVMDLPTEYGLVTIHRAGNVDVESTLSSLLSTFLMISESIPLVIPLHPRTEKQLKRFKLFEALSTSAQITLLPPLGYMAFMAILRQSTFIMTDSGGLQEEATFLGKPCLTLRNNTERPITISEGTNRLVGTDPIAIMKEWRYLADNNYITKKVAPHYWDGQVAGRILDIIREYFYANNKCLSQT